ncbi:hypothetical protein BZG36_00217 [Bifiguratus adelaidae]|uniref:ATP-dependent helicase HRQ1 n=1 Tax=Bifiguratus adelaidae TaxID=1938954 RepID=A0A261Y8A0_9FUNG|nr:hypothetical protein BZG36_00217 [Bifiguratus adelaidae]
MPRKRKNVTPTDNVLNEETVERGDKTEGMPQGAEANDMAVGGDNFEGDAKPRAKVKRSKKSPPITPCDISDWPLYFKNLQKTFRALNTVYTFFSKRKFVAISFENIKSSVENLTQRELIIDDMAAIKQLCPLLISFSYVDKDELNVHLDKDLQPKKREKKKPVGNPFVLLFEFHDGDPEPHIHGKKEHIQDIHSGFAAPMSRVKVTKMIERRNDKFDQAVVAFLAVCRQTVSSLAADSQNKADANMILLQQLDPEKHLTESAVDNIPAQPMLESIDSPPLGDGFVDRDRQSLAAILEEVQEEEFYSSQIVENGRRTFPIKEAVYGELDHPLSPQLAAALEQSKKITRVYSHQAKAINDLRAGHNVIVSTSTASGKSLIYQIPVIQALEADRKAKAMYIFPTKALAQDQKRSMAQLLSLIPGLSDIGTFDGDTLARERNELREEGSVIFTNPDILHVTVLPNAHQWRHFLSALKYVVIDELHYYNGLFGESQQPLDVSKVIPEHSATIGNPENHMRQIFGLEDVALTSIDGSPCGQKQFILWNPPHVDERDTSQGRRGTIGEAAKLLEFLISKGIRTIAFCKVRKTCEVLMKQMRVNLQKGQNAHLLRTVMSYRAGYTPEDRRQIEKRMFAGDLLAIIATNALELGIDIGSLDAVLMVGMPWSISAMWQQSGRAGRRNRDSMTLLIAETLAIDQHYMNHPDDLYSRPHANINIDWMNPLVIESHLQCAAVEQPIHIDYDRKFFGDRAEEICKEHLLFNPEHQVYHCNPKLLPSPAKHVNIRNINEEVFAIVDVTNDRNFVLEELEASRALFTIYEGAVFIHQGISYLVEETNIDQRWSKVRITNVDWTTRQRDYTDVDAKTATKSARIGDSGVIYHHGQLLVASHVFGYFKVDPKGRILDSVEVNMPPIIRKSKGIWVDVPIQAVRQIDEMGIDLMAAIHAAAHSLMSLLPIFSYSVLGDLRTECKSPLATRPRPARISLYEPNPCGITVKTFQFFPDLLTKALETIQACPCKDGCPECVHSTICSESNSLCSKMGAVIILHILLNQPQQALEDYIERHTSVHEALVGVDLDALADLEEFE